MPGKAAKVVITERQHSVLQEISVARTSEVRMAQRARIILLAFEGRKNEQIGAEVGMNPDQVGVWRKRWKGAFTKLVAVECNESRDGLRKAILQVLADEQRSGRRRRITPEQQAQLVALACEQPDAESSPVTRRSSEDLAREAVERGIVDSISARHLRDILKRCDVRPHRHKYWLTSPDLQDADFDDRVAEICRLYQEAPEAYRRDGVHTVCIDEQTGIQALERVAPDLPTRRGAEARFEFEYRRHGTISLFGNLHVPTGQILKPMLNETRTEEDFLENLDNLISHDEAAPWRLIVDNLNTHCSEACVLYVAAVCGITEDLGKKGVRGVLENRFTRMKFLRDPSHRIRFVYLPRHTSWLNQIEIWFGVLRRKVTRFGTFASVPELCERIQRFITYYNSVLAHPYSWTYSGRVLCK